MVARVAAAGALVLAVAIVAVLLLSSGSSYTLRANFQDAGGLVTGDQVLMGPANVGTVNSIALTPNGLAQVTMSLDSSASPVPQGTIARVYENSLSGIANKYVVLEPGPKSAAPIPSGGLIPESDTRSFVSPRSGVRHARPAHPTGASKLHPWVRREHPGQGPPGQSDAPVLRAGALEHERRDGPAFAGRAHV